MVISANVYREAAAIVERWSRIVLFTHERPDGDALGCLTALSRLWTSRGQEVTAYVFDTPADRYDCVLRFAPLQEWPGLQQDQLEQSTDGIVIVDTCARQQLQPVAGLLNGRSIPVLALDHHLTREDIADHYLTDEQASSACLLVAEWAEAAGWEIDRSTAQALYAGMATDTGWFRFSNSDARTYHAAGKLVDLGVRPAELFEAFYMSSSEARMRVLGRMLLEMELHAGGQLAVGTVTQAMLRDYGATPEDCEELVNEMHRMGQVDVAVLVMEQREGPIKISLRSKGKVNVAQIASRSGGGGHAQAAGLRSEDELPVARTQIVGEIIRALEGH